MSYIKNILFRTNFNLIIRDNNIYTLPKKKVYGVYKLLTTSITDANLPKDNVTLNMIG